jgi:AcrR family transcriptional regulator
MVAAYELFARNGIKAVGVDGIIAHAGVAKMTFYRHFPSKDDLVIAFLDRRRKVWSHDWLEAEVKRRAPTPSQRLIAIFDVFDEWFQRDDFEGCSFIRTLLETFGSNGKVADAARFQLADIRLMLRGFAEEAGVSQPDEFVRTWQILMEGSIIAAADGDKLAARRARRVGELLLESAPRIGPT